MTAEENPTQATEKETAASLASLPAAIKTDTADPKVDAAATPENAAPAKAVVASDPVPTAPTADAAKTALPTAAAPTPEPPKPAKKIALIIDDEPANRDFLERLVQQAKYETYSAASGAEAQKIADSLEVPPLILAIDSELPDIKGLELLKIFRAKFPNSKIIMATMLDDRGVINEAFNHGCDVFLVKPHGFMELFKRLQQLDKDPTVLDQLIIDGLGVRPRKR